MKSNIVHWLVELTPSNKQQTRQLRLCTLSKKATVSSLPSASSCEMGAAWVWLLWKACASCESCSCFSSVCRAAEDASASRRRPADVSDSSLVCTHSSACQWKHEVVGVSKLWKPEQTVLCMHAVIVRCTPPLLNSRSRQPQTTLGSGCALARHLGSQVLHGLL